MQSVMLPVRGAVFYNVNLDSVKSCAANISQHQTHLAR